MEQIKKAGNHLIFKKNSGRFAVKDCTTKRWINGDAKADILVAEALITRPEQKPAAPETVDPETVDPETADPETETPAETTG